MREGQRRSSGKCVMKLPVLWAALALSTVAHADILFDQSALNGNSFDITDYRLADSFKPTAGGTVQQLQFWYQAQDQSDLAIVTYAIYADQSAAPGSLLDSGTVNDPTTAYDSASGLFSASFGIDPLAVNSSSTYWLELHAGDSLTDSSGFTISWAAVADNPAPAALMSLTLAAPDTSVGVSGFNQYAFSLTGITAPEPSAFLVWAVIAFAAAGKSFLRRK